ncbi:MAG TPA: methylmalonyl-CoA epimerase [candidate division Zixibacteria bacterium]|nr:methylmalonyl-CoA epimerase [candidate division Zixibacteria bacterium]
MISHVGIAVADLDAAVARYRLLTGGAAPVIVDVPDQKVRVAIFSGGEGAPGHGGGRIELVAPVSDDSPVAKFIAKRGEGLHHICLYVADIERKLAELKAAGARLIDETPRCGAEGNRIAFVHPAGSHGVLLELEEHPTAL